MDLREWITLVVVPAISALWVWYATRYYPALVKRREEDRSFEREKMAESYAQVISINEKFVAAFIKIIDDRLASIDKNLKDLEEEITEFIQQVQKIVTLTENNTLNMNRIGEIHSDIDIELHEIKALLRHKTTHTEVDNKD